MAGLASEATNPRLLQERIERAQAQIAELQDTLEQFSDVATTIAELPKKLSHHVMVPLGKRAMMPGKIVRSNEILAHLGDDYFAWQSASSTVEMIERRKKNIVSQIKDVERSVVDLSEKKSQVDSLFDIKKLYDEENIREIQESEEESEQPVPKASNEDIEAYFEIEEEERRKDEQTAWDWDETMRRIEALEAREAGGDDPENETAASAPEASGAARAAELKAKGNSAFAQRKFADSVAFYSQALALEPSSHILYGNRSAAYHRLKKFREALEDADFAVDLNDSWVKGHYRKACALASLERYSDAADAFARAFELCPTDAKLDEKAQEMRAKATTQQQQRAPSRPAPALTTSFTTVSQMPPPPPASGATIPTNIPAPAFSSSSASFSGSIMEREIVERAAPVAAPEYNPSVATGSLNVGGIGAVPPRSRFAGNNPNGDVVTLQPVGEPQPVKRVSRFKAARGGH